MKEDFNEVDLPRGVRCTATILYIVEVINFSSFVRPFAKELLGSRSNPLPPIAGTVMQIALIRGLLLQLWESFFSNLKFVVVDEAHTYRGIFGSHVVSHCSIRLCRS